MLLIDREWKECTLSSMFKIYTGTDLIINQVIPGNIPIISHSATNNGVATWSEIISNRKLFDCKKAISLADRGNFKAFVQKTDFYIGTRVKALESKKAISTKSLIFIANLIDTQAVKFSYGHNACDNVGRIKILVPINEAGNPDYYFMEAFVREQEEKKKQKYISHIKKAITDIKYNEVPSLDEKDWKDFFIGGEKGLFTINTGKRLTKADMDDGKIPFIGATDSNNGITSWIATPNSSFDKNVLGVNYNGSVVENFYHSYGCIFSDDVKRLHLKNHEDNKYVLLFFKTVILQQKIKYTYGYKFNGQRMERQKILLPINEQGNPDYDYMEQYVKNLMLQKYQQYLEFLNKEQVES